MKNGIDYFSHKTSCNRIPKGIKYLVELYDGKKGSNLDYGGGKYDTATIYLQQHGIRNYVYDPFNRSEKHNKWALKHQFTSVTLLNVLNVIESREERIAVIKDAFSKVKEGGIFIIQIYEGNKSGVGAITKSRTYQHNHIMNHYLDELSAAIGMPFIAFCNSKKHTIMLKRKSRKLEDFLLQKKNETIQK